MLNEVCQEDQMIPDRNAGLHKGMKSIGNSKFMGKYKDYSLI
jgi:hypothetical protein